MSVSCCSGAPITPPIAQPAPLNSDDAFPTLGGGDAALPLTEITDALAGLAQAIAGFAEVVSQIASVSGGGMAGGSGASGATAACCPDAAPQAGVELLGSMGAPSPGMASPSAPEPSPALSTGNSEKFNSAPLKIKGKNISPEQRKNVQEVLKVGVEMGANRKVLESAVATIIQESNAQNINYGDRDSLGLFQQRPSMGWGTPEQVRDPRYAARKYFEKAIPSDKKKPDQSITQLAQSVQRSGFPDAYAQWSGEAKAAVDAFL